MRASSLTVIAATLALGHSGCGGCGEDALSSDHLTLVFDAEGEGSWATFTASAFGDLDCDGDLSTFDLDGWIDSDGEVAGGETVIDWSELE